MEPSDHSGKPPEPHTDAFETIVAASMFMAEAVAPPGWEPPPAFLAATPLSAAGEQAQARLLGENAEMSDGVSHLAVLNAIGGSALFLDLEQADPAAALAAASEALGRGEPRLVWGYGHVLTGRLGTVAKPGGDVTLTATESVELLRELEQAVAQIGKFVAGPYGVVLSCESRWLPPTLGAGPVPCHDPGCRGLHTVFFEPSVPSRSDVISAAGVPREVGQDWARAYRLSVRDGDHYMDDQNTASLPITLANAFSETELRAILQTSLTEHRAVRTHAAQTPELRQLLRRSASDVVERLDTARLLQLLLLQSDDNLIDSIEAALDQGAITIPLLEVRSFRYCPGSVSLGYFDVAAEVSRQGVRLQPSRSDFALSRLERLVREVHADARDEENLTWRLRTLAPPGSADPLHDYLRTTEPTQVLQQLVFDSRAKLAAAIGVLRYGRMALPITPEQTQHLRDRMLWKLGFAVEEFPATVPRFWNRLRTTREAVESATEPLTEAVQAHRSEAVNLFVSTEEILDLSLSYISWALTNDHFGEPMIDRFVFDLSVARETTARLIAAQTAARDEPLVFTEDGKNTLYPLVEGFAVLAEHLESLDSGDPSSHLRAQPELPFYADRSALVEFPWRHTIPFLDLSPRARREVLDAVAGLPRLLARVRLLDVRNRLEHQRETFPSRSQISEALLGLEESLTDFERRGICPTLFRPAGNSTDAVGRSEIVLKNYAGVAAQIERPSMLRLADLPPPMSPQFCLVAAKLSGKGDFLRFGYREQSEYSKLWREFSSAELWNVRGQQSDESDIEPSGSSPEEASATSL